LKYQTEVTRRAKAGEEQTLCRQGDEGNCFQAGSGKPAPAREGGGSLFYLEVKMNEEEKTALRKLDEAVKALKAAGFEQCSYDVTERKDIGENKEWRHISLNMAKETAPEKTLFVW
jgi:hypothetical protein